MILNIDPISKSIRRHKHRFTPFLLGATIMLVTATPTRAETLMDAVDAAYANNPTLVEQRFRQKSTNETYVQTRGLYGPTLGIQASNTYQYAKLHGKSGDVSSGQMALTARQSIYTGGRQRGALAQARANVRSSEEVLRRTEGETIQNVIGAYAAVIRDQQRLAVARENVIVLRQQFDERFARRKVRDATITDLAQSDTRLASGEIQLANAEAQLSVSRGEYLLVVGHEPGDLQPMPELPGLPASIDEAFAIADAENANLAAARHSEEAARANVAAQRGNQRPSATVQASVGKAGSASSLFNQKDYETQVTAVVTVTQPLFQAGTIRSKIRQAQDLSNAAGAVVDSERRQTLQDVVLAWNQLAASRIGVASGSRQVEVSQIAFAGMQREERYGLRSTIEVLNAEQELAGAQLSLLTSYASEYVARAALLLAMGRLDARTVNSAIPAKDPEAEFRKVRWRGMSPTEPVAILLDHIGSASPYTPPKKDLRGANQPKPTGAPTMPAVPDEELRRTPLIPITKSRLVPEDELPASLRINDSKPATGQKP